MPQALRWLALAGVLLFLATAAGLARLERSGPPQREVALEGGIHGTLHLPHAFAADGFREKRPREERPPVVMLMHGFASDRFILSVLARRLAEAGFAAFSFDVRGHGQNRRPFARSRARAESFEADLAVVADFLRASPLVDGSRLALVGHSMGASASLDFATRDAGIDAVVPIAGGTALMGPHRPPNVLFLYAAADPQRIRQRSSELAARLAGVSSAEPRRTYGDPSLGNAVRLVEVAGTDHATVVYAEETARETIAWLDASFGNAPREAPVPEDPRLAFLPWNALSLLLVLPTLGFVVGRLAPESAARPASGAIPELGALAVSLLAMLPLAATTPLSFLPLEVGDTIVGHLWLAGAVAWAVLAWRGATPSVSDVFDARALGAVALALVFAYTGLLPLSHLVHRLTLTPERLAVAVASVVFVLPFAVAFQSAVRRGSVLQSLALGLVGRAGTLAVLVLGVSLGFFAPVLLLMLPSLAFVVLGMELLSLGIYGVSRNVLVIAGVDAAWLCLVIAATMPIRI